MKKPEEFHMVELQKQVRQNIDQKKYLCWMMCGMKIIINEII